MLILRLLVMVLSILCLMEGHANVLSSTTDIGNGEKNSAVKIIELKLDNRKKPGKKSSKKHGKKPLKKPGRKPGKKSGKKPSRKPRKKCKKCKKCKPGPEVENVQPGGGFSFNSSLAASTTTITLPTTTTPLKKWIGGFLESNPAFAYPSPNLTHFGNGSVLPLLGNMDNIDKLDLQQGVKWPEFSWETELGKPESRAFQMFAPYISRLGYTVEGRVYSIICPQMGAYSPTLGSLNVEVTVTGQRGWVNQPYRTMAADMTVVGKIWFGPGAKDNSLVNLLWHSLEHSGFPFSKKNAIVVNTHSRNFTDQAFFSLRDGESTEYEIPEFAKHPEAWSVGNLRVQIGKISKTTNTAVNTFNQLILDIFNVAKGNMLKENNTLYWNVWFTEPQNVNRTEWRNHAEKWRDSIDTGHGSPDGNGTYPKYFNGTLFKPFKEESIWIENELDKIYDWLKKHINLLSK